jgi:segregation and condensation protein B
VSAAPRRRRRNDEDGLDVELADLPLAARWREWMLRVESAIFASSGPVPREALVRAVAKDCRFDDLIADLIHELRGRPYDVALVAGGYGAPRRGSPPPCAPPTLAACLTTASPT